MIKKYHSIAGVVLHVNLILAAVLVGASLFLAFYVYHTFEKQQETIFHAHVEQLSTELNQKILDYKAMGKRMAADPALLAAVKSGSARKMENWSKKSRKLLPDVVGTGIFDSRLNLVGNAKAQNITEECKLHAKQIKQPGKYVKYDVHNNIKPLSHFEFIFPVARTGYWVLISFSTQAIADYIENVAHIASYYALETPRSGSVLTVGKNRGNDQFEAMIGDTGWKLVSRKFITPLENINKMPLVVIAILMILVISAFAVMSWQLIQFFKADLDEIVRAMEVDLDEDNKTTLGTNIYIKEFYNLHRRIAGMISELHESRQFIDEQSLKDPFTGMSNERAFYKSQGKYFNMAQRQIPVAVVLLDVDDLGVINKTLGRDAGDQVIKGIGGILTASVRDSDECFYIGSGRFIVVMVDMQIADALKWYEFLTRRFDVLEQNVKQFKEEKLHLGLSAAVAMVSPVDKTLEGTLIRTEEVLRSVKKQCKGIIVTAKEPELATPAAVAVNDESFSIVEDEFHHPWK